MLLEFFSLRRIVHREEPARPLNLHTRSVTMLRTHANAAMRAFRLSGSPVARAGTWNASRRMDSDRLNQQRGAAFSGAAAPGGMEWFIRDRPEVMTALDPVMERYRSAPNLQASGIARLVMGFLRGWVQSGCRGSASRASDLREGVQKRC